MEDFMKKYILNALLLCTTSALPQENSNIPISNQTVDRLKPNSESNNHMISNYPGAKRYSEYGRNTTSDSQNETTIPVSFQATALQTAAVASAVGISGATLVFAKRGFYILDSKVFLAAGLITSALGIYCGKLFFDEKNRSNLKKDDAKEQDDSATPSKKTILKDTLIYTLPTAVCVACLIAIGIRLNNTENFEKQELSKIFNNLTEKQIEETFNNINLFAEKTRFENCSSIEKFIFKYIGDYRKITNIETFKKSVILLKSFSEDYIKNNFTNTNY